jgi:hypothetical protein
MDEQTHSILFMLMMVDNSESKNLFNRLLLNFKKHGMLNIKIYETLLDVEFKKI